MMDYFDISIIRAQTVNVRVMFTCHTTFYTHGHSSTHIQDWVKSSTIHNFKQSLKLLQFNSVEQYRQEGIGKRICIWNLQAVKYAYSMSLPMSLCVRRIAKYSSLFSFFPSSLTLIHMELYTPQHWIHLKRVPIVVVLLLYSFLHATTVTVKRQTTLNTSYILHSNSHMKNKIIALLGHSFCIYICFLSVDTHMQHIALMCCAMRCSACESKCVCVCARTICLLWHKAACACIHINCQQRL